MCILFPVTKSDVVQHEATLHIDISLDPQLENVTWTRSLHEPLFDQTFDLSQLDQTGVDELVVQNNLRIYPSVTQETLVVQLEEDIR